MTQRTLSAIIFSVILLIELAFYLNRGSITSIAQTGEAKGFFGGMEVVRNTAAEKERDTNLLIVIGITIAVGAFVTFSLPNKKIGKDK